MTVMTRGARQRGSLPVLLVFLTAVVVVAGLGSLATVGNSDGWYDDAAKPWFTPPDWLFGPVWTTLYLMMALAAWLVWRNGGSTVVWWVQLALNLAWSPVFFALEQLWLGFVVIVALDVAVAITLVLFRGFSRTAAWLFVAYLAWVLYATALNAGVAVLN